MNKELIKTIELRKKEDIINLLRSNGINKRDRWKGYSQAKRICFQGQFIDTDTYDKQIAWICDYLGI